MQEFDMVLEQVVIRLPIDRCGPEDIIVVREEGEKDSEKEAYGCSMKLADVS